MCTVLGSFLTLLEKNDTGSLIQMARIVLNVLQWV